MGNNITRLNGKETKLIEVECPEIVHQYNKHIGGVDLCDMLMALYRIRLGTQKWYFTSMVLWHWRCCGQWMAVVQETRPIRYGSKEEYVIIT